jgi:phosphate transport system permease protein
VKRFAELLLVIFSWLALLVFAASFLFLFVVLLLRVRGLDAVSLFFGDTPPVDALLHGLPVFDGIYPALLGTVSVVMAAVLCALLPGIFTGIYLAEFAGPWAHRIVNLLVDVLAGLPSIVVGLAGFSFMVLLHNVFPGAPGPCMAWSALALGFLILPYLVRTTETALQAIPAELRRTAPTLGATKVQNIFFVLLPFRAKDLLGGVILATGRAAEDTAVIMLTGVVASAPGMHSLFKQFEALPFYIYYMSSQYRDLAELQYGFGASVTLLLLCGLFFVAAFLLQSYVSFRFQGASWLQK